MQKIKDIVAPLVHNYVLPWAKAWIAGIAATVVQLLNDSGFELPDTARDVFFALGVGAVTFVATWFFPNKTK